MIWTATLAIAFCILLGGGIWTVLVHDPAIVKCERCGKRVVPKKLQVLEACPYCSNIIGPKR